MAGEPWEHVVLSQWEHPDGRIGNAGQRTVLVSGLCMPRRSVKALRAMCLPVLLLPLHLSPLPVRLPSGGQRQHSGSRPCRRNWPLHGHGAFKLVPRPHGARVVPCRWVFTANRDEHGNVMRFKARLVVKGFLQRLGVRTCQ
jgi:hypothetical protein